MTKDLVIHNHSSSMNKGLVIHNHSSSMTNDLVIHNHSSSLTKDLVIHNHSSSLVTKYLFRPNIYSKKILLCNNFSLWNQFHVIFFPCV
jgi:hypothetical protein